VIFPKDLFSLSTLIKPKMPTNALRLVPRMARRNADFWRSKMTNKLEKWEKLRAKGKWNCILLYGVLGWGVSTG
jgi:hypothetical protein